LAGRRSNARPADHRPPAGHAPRLVFIAGAYVILHELGHRRIAESGCNIGYDLREERLCDAYARKMLLDETGTFAASTGDPEHLVRAKRILVIVLAKLLIITVTPRDRWNLAGSRTRPATAVPRPSLREDPLRHTI
jgi:hypothetical protein